jgi:2'-5' RNA ligase
MQAAQRPATRRLFIALWPAAPARRALCDWLHGWTWPAQAAVVDPARLHLTLHFLGALPEPRLAALREALAVPARGMAPFDLRFDRLEHWPHGLVVLGPSEAPEPLRALHAGLADTLRALQWPLEARPFRPHVTLARKAQGAVAPAGAPDIRWPVRAFALVQSADGYHTLQSYGAGADRQAAPDLPGPPS